MDNALIAAATQYAELSQMTMREVLEEIQAGNETIKRTVQMLMFALA